ncbi:hypothetical protein K504DRAFT_529017 [Pleomassaria siparia CBS 279.74]|uniref:Uncharacterized protein n=1 Tax=Pleomassaria siparia CBS 279.74 TaxID=1314801 RepID=A0A6G1KPG4_9PLEO|nr:hypothetical protein K504DRAFT_529017 [Pleomassaria siparia CBS 279.74]
MSSHALGNEDIARPAFEFNLKHQTVSSSTASGYYASLRAPSTHRRMSIIAREETVPEMAPRVPSQPASSALDFAYPPSHPLRQKNLHLRGSEKDYTCPTSPLSRRRSKPTRPVITSETFTPLTEPTTRKRNPVYEKKEASRKDVQFPENYDKNSTPAPISLTEPLPSKRNPSLQKDGEEAIPVLIPLPTPRLEIQHLYTMSPPTPKPRN